MAKNQSYSLHRHVIYRHSFTRPIEIKNSIFIRGHDFKRFEFLRQLKTPIWHGRCFGKSWVRYTKNIDIVPIGYVSDKVWRASRRFRFSIHPIFQPHKSRKFMWPHRNDKEISHCISYQKTTFSPPSLLHPDWMHPLIARGKTSRQEVVPLHQGSAGNKGASLRGWAKPKDQALQHFLFKRPCWTDPRLRRGMLFKHTHCHRGHPRKFSDARTRTLPYGKNLVSVPALLLRRDSHPRLASPWALYLRLSSQLSRP